MIFKQISIHPLDHNIQREFPLSSGHWSGNPYLTLQSLSLSLFLSHRSLVISVHRVLLLMIVINIGRLSNVHFYEYKLTL